MLISNNQLKVSLGHNGQGCCCPCHPASRFFVGVVLHERVDKTGKDPDKIIYGCLSIGCRTSSL
uniref:Uncharacterized protein n=1 Tax=Arundo donax TaxID=35708 RepID=A0A0A8YMQ7_ARUDO